MTTNPFDEIIESLNSLKRHLSGSSPISSNPPIEIIGREELCKRLDITEPTVIRWEKKGKIPCFRVGSAVRYNWFNVIESLEGKKSLA